MDQERAIDEAAQAITDADAVLIGAGAGMGVDSGLPDFRGNEGFWNAYPAFRNRGLSFYDLANPVWFHRNPRQAWGFYGHRLNLYRSTTPHAGFSIMRRWNADCFVFTSNVDGQFQKSGYDDQTVVECHGSILHLQCAAPCCDEIWSADGVDVVVDESTFLAEEPLPQCPTCGEIARPNILMFGDGGWVRSRTARQTSRFGQWFNHQQNRSLVGIEIGAGTAVPSVRYEMEERTRGSNRLLVRINLREPDCPNNISIAGRALEILQRIDEIIAAKRK